MLGGIIDPGYTGEIMVLMHNLSDRGKVVDEGFPLAQLIVMPCHFGNAKIVDKVRPRGDRGESGFGSTDVKRRQKNAERNEGNPVMQVSDDDGGLSEEELRQSSGENFSLAVARLRSKVSARTAADIFARRELEYADLYDLHVADDVITALLRMWKFDKKHQEKKCHEG